MSINNFKVVRSDRRTTVRGFLPCKLSITFIRSSGEAHRSGSSGHSNGNSVRPGTPSTRVGGSDLEGVGSLFSVGKLNRNRERSNVIGLSISLALVTSLALMNFVSSGSSDGRVSQSDRTSSLVDNSEVSNSSSLRNHSSSKLSRSSRRSKCASSLVTGSTSNDNLRSGLKVVSSSRKLSHRNGARHDLSIVSVVDLLVLIVVEPVEVVLVLVIKVIELVVVVKSTVIVSKIVVTEIVEVALVVVESRSVALFESNVLRKSSGCEGILATNEELNLVRGDGSTSVFGSNPSDVDRAFFSNSLRSNHL